jgi:hypothetical protein
LKKRSKKLLFTAGFGSSGAKAGRSGSFLLLFFKKEALSHVTLCQEPPLAKIRLSGASPALVSRKQQV